RFSRDWSSDVCSSDLDSGRETRAYVSAFDRSRVHQSRLYRFEKRRLVANFGALLGERQIRCATWSIDRPEIGVMSDPQISDDAQIGRASCRERGSGTG